MRIGLFIDTTNLGGAETMVFEIARLLRQADHEPILLHFASRYVKKFAEQIKIESVALDGHKQYKKIATLPSFMFRFSRALKKLRIDCVHSHLFGPIVATAPAAWLAGIRHIGTLHDVYMIEESPRRVWLLKLAALLGCRFVVVSSAMQQFYVHDFHLPTLRVTHIPNFAPAHQPAVQKAAMRRRLRVSNSEILLISVGRLVPLKQYERLIECCHKLTGTTAVRLIIVGEGPERPALEARIRQFQLEQQVILLGERDDVPNLLEAADCFLLASKTEGLSRSILEALAAGLPVVATDVGGNSELVQDSVNGFLVPVDDADGFKQRVEEIVGDAMLRQSMSHKSREFAMGRFGVEPFFREHLRLYTGNRAF